MTEYAYQVLADRRDQEVAKLNDMQRDLEPVIAEGQRAEGLIAGQVAIVDSLNQAMEIIGPKMAEEVAAETFGSIQRSLGGASMPQRARELRGDHW